MLRPDRCNSKMNVPPPDHFSFPPPPSNFPPPFFNQRPHLPYDALQGHYRSNFQTNIPPPFNISNPPPPPQPFQSLRPPYFSCNQAFQSRPNAPVDYIRSPGGVKCINLQVPPPNFNTHIVSFPTSNINNSNGIDITKHSHMLMSSEIAESKNEYLDHDNQKDTNHQGHHILDKWLKERGKLKKVQVTYKPTPHDKLWSWMNQLRELLHILTSMSTHAQEMTENFSSLDNSSWEKSVSEFEKLKKEYSSYESVLDEQPVSQHETVLRKIQKKRKRLAIKRLHDTEYKINLSKSWEEKSKQIDIWQERIQAKIRDENLRKARKEAADRTLGKVTKEIQDASRLIETMLSLKKLRLIRRDAAQKRGDTELGESRQTFEDKISDMTRLVQAQLECYKEEEKRLKEVIQSEQNERTEKERLFQATAKKQKEKEQDDELKTLLFGDQEVSISDPLYPFYRFYSQAQENLQAFIQIRHDWDSFLVTEKTPASSTLPMSWVIPEVPSSAAWAQVLQ